ncbi:class I SAM-dependent methyltransferase [Herbaspirillum rubrisubalbicans]|uniref:class I SAM-dependent methyltransferase n=1 Tax=Herbaspirillum rubrisubalbicans TaxID=80842 RepID=UPI001559288D|nr:class I SAM-dependent methyltransferase [Herbaspirillum rubrisubalbicans]
MKQTPAHDFHNPDLLSLMPETSSKIIEVGCSSGALAKAFKQKNSNCQYIGIEIDSDYIELAKRYCDKCLNLDIENVDDDFYLNNSDCDCWVFGDTLEHLRDPWKVLKKIRDNIQLNGKVVACIPNAQHWSLQVKLSIGDFRYEDQGLLDKTHLRWFTRQTIIEMFEQVGFKIEAGQPRIFDEPNRDLFLPLIEKLADRAGVDSKVAIQDALPRQYVIRAIAN